MLLSDFVELFFVLSLTLQTGPQKATQCDVTEKTKEIFFPVTQHWPQCWKEGTTKLWRLLLHFSKSPSSPPCLSPSTDVTSGPLVTCHSWKGFCLFLPCFLLSQLHILTEASTAVTKQLNMAGYRGCWKATPHSLGSSSLYSSGSLCPGSESV